MRRTLGLIGGIGYQSTLEYYSRIMSKYYQRLGDLEYPEMAVYSLSHARFKFYEDAGDLKGYTAYIKQGMDRVIAAGAEVLALAANSPHAVIEELRKLVEFPILSAVESALRGAQDRGLRQALLLGIRFTMQSTFYQERFAKEDITLIAPSTTDQDVVHRVIYEELLQGKILDTSRKKILALAEKYSVDGLVLGCMKLPILLGGGESPLPIVDTLDLHTTDILDYILGAEDKGQLILE